MAGICNLFIQALAKYQIARDGKIPAIDINNRH